MRLVIHSDSLGIAERCGPCSLAAAEGDRMYVPAFVIACGTLVVLTGIVSLALVLVSKSKAARNNRARIVLCVLDGGLFLALVVLVMLQYRDGRERERKYEERELAMNQLSAEYLPKYQAVVESMDAVTKGLPGPQAPHESSANKIALNPTLDFTRNGNAEFVDIQGLMDKTFSRGFFAESSSSELVDCLHHVHDYGNVRLCLPVLDWSMSVAEAVNTAREELERQLHQRYLVVCRVLEQSMGGRQLPDDPSLKATGWVQGTVESGSVVAAVYLVDLADSSMKGMFRVGAENSKFLKYERGNPVSMARAIGADLEVNLQRAVIDRLEHSSGSKIPTDLP
jgi:hypothetical protein